ncbi:uncharacterized protein LOC144437432 [Glandiceps talaboti]
MFQYGSLVVLVLLVLCHRTQSQATTEAKSDINDNVVLVPEEVTQSSTIVNNTLEDDDNIIKLIERNDSDLNTSSLSTEADPSVTENQQYTELFTFPPDFTLPSDLYDPCLFNNGGCSDICLPFDDISECACPNGFGLIDDRKTCEGMSW